MSANMVSVYDRVDRCINGIRGLIGTAYYKRTICEVHREIWDITECMEDSIVRNEIQALTAVAYDMATRMMAKLQEGKSTEEITTLERGMWKNNEGYKAKKTKRGKRLTRVIKLNRP